MNRLAEREAQVLATTEQEREEGNDSNPVLFAEARPNRFRILTYFFPEDDGVKIEEDLDLNTVAVEYFTEGETITLTEGALYEWALNQYEND